MKTSDEIRKETQEELSKLGRRNRRFVHLVCSICHKTCQVRTSNPTMYTEAVKQKWVCFTCGFNQKKEKVITPVETQIVTQDQVTKELLNKGKDVVKEFDTTKEVVVVSDAMKEACKILAKDDKALTEIAEQYLAMKTKTCPKCKTEKLVSEFGKDKSTKDGMYYICKICTKPTIPQKGGTDEKLPSV